MLTSLCTFIPWSTAMPSQRVRAHSGAPQGWLQAATSARSSSTDVAGAVGRESPVDRRPTRNGETNAASLITHATHDAQVPTPMTRSHHQHCRSTLATMVAASMEQSCRALRRLNLPNEPAVYRQPRNAMFPQAPSSLHRNRVASRHYRGRRWMPGLPKSTHHAPQQHFRRALKRCLSC